MDFAVFSAMVHLPENVLFRGIDYITFRGLENYLQNKSSIFLPVIQSLMMHSFYRNNFTPLEHNLVFKITSSTSALWECYGACSRKSITLERRNATCGWHWKDFESTNTRNHYSLLFFRLYLYSTFTIRIHISKIVSYFIDGMRSERFVVIVHIRWIISLWSKVHVSKLLLMSKTLIWELMLENVNIFSISGNLACPPTW